MGKIDHAIFILQEKNVMHHEPTSEQGLAIHVASSKPGVESSLHPTAKTSSAASSMVLSLGFSYTRFFFFAF
jgi:hypothetical protein